MLGLMATETLEPYHSMKQKDLRYLLKVYIQPCYRSRKRRLWLLMYSTIGV